LARYNDAVCRLCRREGLKLFLKGSRCFTDKCAIERRNYPPGQHGLGRSKQSAYGQQLREKQKAKRIYGLLEGQFRRYFAQAEGQKGVTGENLLRLLERRLDNVIVRLGFAVSRRQARQLIGHGHFLVNGRRVNVPSFQVKPGDIVSVKENSSAVEVIRGATETTATVPAWLQADFDSLVANVLRLPERDEISAPVQEQLIVELYSK
jgi:small subunit ribosomal protein S4